MPCSKTLHVLVAVLASVSLRKDFRGYGKLIIGIASVELSHGAAAQRVEPSRKEIKKNVLAAKAQREQAFAYEHGTNGVEQSDREVSFVPV